MQARVARRAGRIFSIDGSARRKTRGVQGLLERVVENCDGDEGGSKRERENARSMSCSLYLRRSHVISAVIGLGYRYVCIMPR